MNTFSGTGYLLKDAWEGTTKTGVLKLLCDVMIENGEGEHIPWRCEFVKAALILKCRDYLTSGRPFVFQAVLDGRLFQEHGVAKGWTRFLRIEHAEFPARTITKDSKEETADAA
jgi:hypothetical protein